MISTDDGLPLIALDEELCRCGPISAWCGPIWLPMWMRLVTELEKNKLVTSFGCWSFKDRPKALLSADPRRLLQAQGAQHWPKVPGAYCRPKAPTALKEQCRDALADLWMNMYINMCMDMYAGEGSAQRTWPTACLWTCLHTSWHMSIRTSRFSRNRLRPQWSNQWPLIYLNDPN